MIYKRPVLRSDRKQVLNLKFIIITKITLSATVQYPRVALCREVLGFKMDNSNPNVKIFIQIWHVFHFFVLSLTHFFLTALQVCLFLPRSSMSVKLSAAASETVKIHLPTPNVSSGVRADTDAKNKYWCTSAFMVNKTLIDPDFDLVYCTPSSARHTLRFCFTLAVPFFSNVMCTTGRKVAV